MSRKIYCQCGDYVGEIRDAKLKKGLSFICERCAKKQAFINEFNHILGEKHMLNKMRGFLGGDAS